MVKFIEVDWCEDHRTDIGYASTNKCVLCTLDDNLQFKWANPEAFKKRARDRMKRWRRENRERYLRVSRRRRKKNLVKRRKYHREKHLAYRRKRYKEVREIILARHKKWIKNNVAKSKIRIHRYRVNLLKAKGSFTATDIQRLFFRQKGKCSSCGCSIIKGYDVDHKKPLSRGGSNYPRNLQLLCDHCNSSKGQSTMAEWNKRRAAL